jgi:hypothetical protein
VEITVDAEAVAAGVNLAHDIGMVARLLAQHEEVAGGGSGRAPRAPVVSLPGAGRRRR